MCVEDQTIHLPKDTINYLLRFLMDDSPRWKYIYYGLPEEAPETCKVVIIPFIGQMNNEHLNNSLCTPLLFGRPEEKIIEGKIVLFADLIQSSFFLLSRREEVLKRNKRDEYGRFLAEFSFLSKDGFVFRPIVDEYGIYLREVVAKILETEHIEKKGFRKIWLTHDVDRPFFYTTLGLAVKQCVKNFIPKHKSINHPLRAYFKLIGDPYYTFPQIVEFDQKMKETLQETEVESLFFLITAKATRKNDYYSIHSFKYQKLLKELTDSHVSFGLHVSHEAGIDPEKIESEVRRFPIPLKGEIYSRHHFLRWREPEHIIQMEKAGITDDFSLSFPDCIGFRVGTSHPYRFINPLTGELSGVMIHPLEIMECSLGAGKYMGLNYNQALEICKKVIRQVYEYNGELNLLFHNTSFTDEKFDYLKLYKDLFEYVYYLLVPDERRMNGKAEDEPCTG